jgi:hypothetical protein
MTTVKHNLVHLLEDGDLMYNDGVQTYSFTGLKAGEDFVVAGAALTLTSTGAVLIS